MTLAKDIRKTVTDTTPVYAAVGVTDLAVERLRDARTRAAAVRKDLDVSAMQDRAVKRFEKVTEQVQQIPAQVRSQTVEVAGKAPKASGASKSTTPTKLTTLTTPGRAPSPEQLIPEQPAPEQKKTLSPTKKENES